MGGITPGSMPPNSRSVEEEGVLIDDFLLIDQGELREAETRALFGSGAWPSRNVEMNLADLKSQVAACARGAEELERMVAEFGRETVDAYMGHVQDNAEEAVRRVLADFGGGEFALEMDDGAIIRVRISVNAETRSARVDFTGTSDQRLPFNAPRSITRAAVMYVFRTLVDDAIP
nr:hydantoinase B/oxoprolinase family protein [Brevundimonas goettingensis]